MTAADPARVTEALRLELRRGTLVLAVLACLRRERFGAEVLDVLGDAGVAIESGALYPMLRRLEEQGLLASERRSEDGRLKRFYLTTRAGHDLLALLVAEFGEMSDSLHRLLEQTHARA